MRSARPCCGTSRPRGSSPPTSAAFFGNFVDQSASRSSAACRRSTPPSGSAQVLEVSLDQLATGRGPAEPPAFKHARIFERMRQLDAIPPERQELALRVLDTVTAGHELEQLANRLRR